MRPPQPPVPWTGVRDATHFGADCMQTPYVISTGQKTSEDCLTVSVWSAAHGRNARRPVMVFIYGGAFIGGSSAYPLYDGAKLAAAGVVVVGFNYRVGIFGFLAHPRLSAESPQHASGNYGLLDQIAALKWVQQNIPAFGGDPNNVTIFGESAGGVSVHTLLTSPLSRGLFHKAIIESGSALKGIHREDANKTTERILTKLGLEKNQVDELQNLPMARLLSAIDNRGAAPGTAPFIIAPVVDGRTLPRDPFDPTAPEISAEIPLIIGSVNTEGTFFTPPDSPLFSLDEAGMRTRLTTRFGEAADKFIDLYRKEMPNASPSQIYFMVNAFPAAAITQAERKVAQGKAPVYMYLFTWETPVEGGKRHSPHTVELPFVFNNVMEQPEEVGNGPELQPLADKVSGAWTAFARTGNPNVAGAPKWLPYTENERATMIINNEWKIMNDPRHEVRLIMNTLPNPATLVG